MDDITSTAISNKWRIAVHLSTWSGIVGPILFVLLFTVAGFLYPGYSPMSQVISTLGSMGPYPWLQIVNFLVCGFLLVAFSISFFREMHAVIGRKSLITCTIFLVLAGMGLIDAGIFTAPPGDVQAAFHSTLHTAGFLTIFFSLTCVFFLLGWPLHKVPAWRRYGWYSIIAGIVTFVLFVVFVLVAGLAPQVIGLWNRILVIEAFAWYVVMGCRFLALERARKSA
jgi:hypothetical membrane protein